MEVVPKIGDAQMARETAMDALFGCRLYDLYRDMEAVDVLSVIERSASFIVGEFGGCVSLRSMYTNKVYVVPLSILNSGRYRKL